MQTEFKGLDNVTDDAVVIYRDLKVGEQPFAQILEYTVAGCTYFSTVRNNRYREGKPIPQHYVEIHLPENQGLAGGNEYWIEGKIPQHGSLTEIR